MQSHQLSDAWIRKPPSSHDLHQSEVELFADETLRPNGRLQLEFRKCVVLFVGGEEVAFFRNCSLRIFWAPHASKAWVLLFRLVEAFSSGISPPCCGIEAQPGSSLPEPYAGSHKVSGRDTACSHQKGLLQAPPGHYMDRKSTHQ